MEFEQLAMLPPPPPPPLDLMPSPLSPMQEMRYQFMSMEETNGKDGAVNIYSGEEEEQEEEEKHVTFGAVRVRRYSLTMGDNPNIRGGYPLGLDWKHTNEEVTDLEDFEDSRESDRLLLENMQEEGRLSVEERKCRLQSMGFTEKEVRHAEIQRKIRMTTEWAYGKDAKGAPKSFPLETTKLILQQYVV